MRVQCGIVLVCFRYCVVFWKDVCYFSNVIWYVVFHDNCKCSVLDAMVVLHRSTVMLLHRV